MGYLCCRDISKIFIDHLKNTGPISIDQTVRKYDKKTLGKRDDDWKIQQGMACEHSVLHYMLQGIIEPANRGDLIPVVQLWRSTNITAKDEIKLFIEYASVDELNGVIGEAANYLDESYSWFDRIVWKMTDKAKERLGLLNPFDGVDL